MKVTGSAGLIESAVSVLVLLSERQAKEARRLINAVRRFPHRNWRPVLRRSSGNEHQQIIGFAFTEAMDLCNSFRKTLFQPFQIIEQLCACLRGKQRLVIVALLA